MEYLKYLVGLVLHFDEHLLQFISDYDKWTYLILFLIIFCETGLVVTPILPGDSLLFAAGAFAAAGKLNISLLFLLLGVAAILGDAVNYAIGNFMGPKVLTRDGRFLKKKYLDAHAPVLRCATAARRSSCAIRADRAHVCAVSGGRGEHVVSAIRQIQHCRCRAVDFFVPVQRLRLRQYCLGAEEFRGGAVGHRADICFAGRVRGVARLASRA